MKLVFLYQNIKKSICFITFAKLFSQSTRSWCFDRCVLLVQHFGRLYSCRVLVRTSTPSVSGHFPAPNDQLILFVHRLVSNVPRA